MCIFSIIFGRNYFRNFRNYFSKDLFLFLPLAVKELNLRPEPRPGSSPAGAGFRLDPATQPGWCWEMPPPTPPLHGSAFLTYGYVAGLRFGVTVHADSLRHINDI